MAIRLSSWLSRPLSLRSLVVQARLAVRLFREPRVPALLKAVPVLAGLYLISPIDLVPDFLPGLGQLDDLGVILAALELFVRLCPAGVQAHHREALSQRRRYAPMASNEDIIEAEWRHG
jgi:uncharacterized membrane protein YkvA (DUF1232 family)